MKKNTIRFIGFAAVALIWAALVLAAWFHPAQDISESERRKLEQFPELSVTTILDGKFMSKFENYTLDQFPLRDSFRQLKALFHYNALGQKDNNDIYIADGHAAEIIYPLSENSVNNAAKKLTAIYDDFLAFICSNLCRTCKQQGYENFVRIRICRDFLLCSFKSSSSFNGNYR